MKIFLSLLVPLLLFVSCSSDEPVNSEINTETVDLLAAASSARWLTNTGEIDVESNWYPFYFYTGWSRPVKENSSAIAYVAATGTESLLCFNISSIEERELNFKVRPDGFWGSSGANDVIVELNGVSLGSFEIADTTSWQEISITLPANGQLVGLNKLCFFAKANHSKPSLQL
jgi:hypothetical protein